ncbi:MAG: hypothetical protein LBH48_05100 [Bifidobacteriaceae bacterium]|nr:hypothetical protein [Bifidobacteriaceae bacterium]
MSVSHSGAWAMTVLGVVAVPVSGCAIGAEGRDEGRAKWSITSSLEDRFGVGSVSVRGPGQDGWRSAVLHGGCDGFEVDATVRVKVDHRTEEVVVRRTGRA